MGKTTPTCRDTMRDALEPFDNQSRRALRRDRQKAYEAFRDDLEELTMAMATANAADVWWPIVISANGLLWEWVLELDSRLNELKDRVG